MAKENRFWTELNEVRQTTRALIESVLLDIWPHNAAIVDFGLDSQKHYEALYYPIREHQIMPKELDEALGDGEKLTALVQAAASNPHKDVHFHTSWDGIFGRPMPQGALSEEEKLSRTLGNLAEKGGHPAPMPPSGTAQLSAGLFGDGANTAKETPELSNDGRQPEPGISLSDVADFMHSVRDCLPTDARLQDVAKLLFAHDKPKPALAPEKGNDLHNDGPDHDPGGRRR
jgi:hypothetical protein